MVLFAQGFKIFMASAGVIKALVYNRFISATLASGAGATALCRRSAYSNHSKSYLQNYHYILN